MARNDILSTVSTRRTPQSEPARAEQVKNAAGGYVFQVDDLARLRRFLTLGTDGATYYTSAKDLTKDNAQVVFRLAETNHPALVNTIVTISTEGRAPKANPGLFALAIACSVGSAEERRMALAALPLVARTGTHLFTFATYVEQFRGWGRSLRRGVADWYLEKHSDDLAFQAVKYRQREGWTHRDLLRLSHPKTDFGAMRSTFDWIVRGSVGEETPAIIEGFLKANESGVSIQETCRLIREHRLTWEMLPDEALAQREVWGALLDVGMGATALMRQLPRLTRLGMLPQMGGRTAEVAGLLQDPTRLKKGRVHPINVLVAQRTYASGHGARSESTWAPTRQIVDALDAGFYAAFGAVEPAGKRTLIGLDVSGSMGSPVSNLPLSCREASVALSMVQMATEQDVALFGFTSKAGTRYGWGNRHETEMTPLSISPRQRLDDVIRAVDSLNFGATDCSMPMMYAMEKGLEVDTFVIYTDGETWHGKIHPFQALEVYRQQTGIDARLVVVAMTATGTSIANPKDPGMLDVSGFDSAVPNLIADFSRGSI